MITFSQIVDDMVLETRRLDLVAEIARYLNQTIREVHFEPERNNVCLFKNNFREDQITASVDTGQTWVIPDLAIFQKEHAFRFDSVWDSDGDPVYASPMTPGPAMNRSDYFYYQAGDTFVFGGKVGYGGVGGVISIAWFEYPSRLKYYAAADRPATWDEESGWSYHATYDVDATTRLAARNLVSNWLTEKWTAVMEEGLRAKVYKRLSDDVRQRTCYSLYQQLRRGLITSELAVSI